MNAKAPSGAAQQSPPTLGPGTPPPLKVLPSQDAAALAALQLVLKIERDARNAATEGELVFLIANETRKVVKARQVFVVVPGDKTTFEVVGISSLTLVDRNAPAVRWMERIVGRLAKQAGPDQPRMFALPAYCKPNDPETAAYPFREMLWVPLTSRRDTLVAGLMLTREDPWSEADLPIVTRLAEAYAHALLALRKASGSIFVAMPSWRWLLGLAALAGLLFFLPVPLTALAPVEVAPDGADVIAAPIEGVIEEIAVEANTRVKAGDVLFRYNDTTTRNTLAVAERDVQVAEAKWRQISQAAFVDQAAKRELAITKAEYDLKSAERDYARDMLERSIVRAARDGLAVFGDKRELVGRPVTVGQRIMELADPDKVAFKINVPIEDAIVLEAGASVRVFLDNDPLHPLMGKIRRASYAARVNEANQLTFRVDAKPDLAGKAIPRLGLRGTAQLYGPKVALGYYLFRRPITYVRQHFGI